MSDFKTREALRSHYNATGNAIERYTNPINGKMQWAELRGAKRASSIAHHYYREALRAAGQRNARNARKAN